MKIVKGEKGTVFSWQDEFPKTSPCGDCDGEARLAFVAQEEGGEDDGVRVCAYHENKPDEFWPHDAIAVAVYFCKKCHKAITLWNQA